MNSPSPVYEQITEYLLLVDFNTHVDHPHLDVLLHACMPTATHVIFYCDVEKWNDYLPPHRNETWEFFQYSYRPITFENCICSRELAISESVPFRPTICMIERPMSPPSLNVLPFLTNNSFFCMLDIRWLPYMSLETVRQIQPNVKRIELYREHASWVEPIRWGSLPCIQYLVPWEKIEYVDSIATGKIRTEPTLAFLQLPDAHYFRMKLQKNAQTPPSIENQEEID